MREKPTVYERLPDQNDKGARGHQFGIESMSGFMVIEPPHNYWLLPEKPSGNWQKLVAPVGLEEAKKELHEWISKNMLGSGYDRLVNKAAELFAGVPQEPEVIEGKGQAVTEGQQGRYVFQRADRQSSVETVLKLAGSLFEKGFRYMRCPAFPPRPTFTPPPKPEQVLVRCPDDGEIAYAIKSEGVIVRVRPGVGATQFDPGEVELIDEQTGEVIQ